MSGVGDTGRAGAEADSVAFDPERTLAGNYCQWRAEANRFKLGA